MKESGKERGRGRGSRRGEGEGAYYVKNTEFNIPGFSLLDYMVLVHWVEHISFMY